MFTADLLERLVKTYLQTFATVFLTSFVVPANVYDGGAWKAAAGAALLAAAAAGLSAATSMLSRNVGDRDSASVLPVESPTAAVPSIAVSGHGSAEDGTDAQAAAAPPRGDA